MIGSSFLDDIETDLGGDFFDHIDDLLDFPMEDIEGLGVGGDCDAFQGVWPPPPSDILAGSTTNLFSTGKNNNNTPTDNNCNRSISEVPTELSVPYEDIAQLEWLSNFVEDSFSAGSITVEKDSSDDNKETHPFQTSSPVSVLESSSSCSGGSGGGGRAMPLSPDTFVPGRARSKRPRPATFNPRPVIPLISPTSSMTEPTPQPFSAAESQFEFENYAESLPLKKIQKPVAMEQQKMKKKKKKLPPLAGGTEQSAAPQAVAIRKCLHCEITKTPQWRAGPLGPKTLCNACGVRYKSGRLFPEYRPAASPTFVASLHSNSHKKVVEMRNKVGHKPVTASTVTATAAVPELVPNRSYLFDYNI